MMKTKIYKRVITFLIALSLFFVGFGSSMNTEVFASGEEPIYENGTGLFDKELFLGAWCEPPSSNTDFEVYKDAGFNVMYLANKNSYNGNMLKYYLEKCEEHDLKAMLMLGVNRKDPISIRLADKDIYDLNDFPAFLGLIASDEPIDEPTPMNTERGIYKNFPSIFDYLYDEYQYLETEYPGKLFETVICSGEYPTSQYWGAMEDYEDKVLSKMAEEDRLVSIDCYPYKVESGRETKTGRLVFRLAKGREAASEYNSLKFIYYYQQEWAPLYREIISAQEITYQLYTAMAFGVNGFTAYKYETYWNNNFAQLETFIKNYYGYNEMIYYNKLALEEVKSFDHIYLDFAKNWQGIMFAEGSQNTRTVDRANEHDAVKFLNSYPGLTSVSATQDTLVGIMKDSNGNDGFMITNQSDSLDRLVDSVSVKFSNKTNAVVINGGVKTVQALENNVLNINIAPGSGALVIPF